MRLYVVYVRSFSGRDGQDWADRSAQASQLGRRDALLAVAVDDRAYGISLDEAFPVSDDVVDGHRDPGRPSAAGRGRLGGRGGRAGRRAAHRPGLGRLGRRLRWQRAAGRARRRRGRGGRRRGVRCWPAGGDAEPATAPAGAAPAPPALPDPAPGETTDDLAYHASSALIELDDAVQTSEHELGLAQTQFGDEAVARLPRGAGAVARRAGAGLRAAPAHRRREAGRGDPPRPAQPDPAPVRHRGPAARRPVGRLRPPPRPRAEPAHRARGPEAQAELHREPGAR